MAATYSLTLVRHGQSTWNLENRFTGWTDVGLTPQGEQEALTGGQLLRDRGFTYDVAYTSVLKRAIKTLWIIMETMELEWIPVIRAWQLNERHYGALQGLNKSEMAAKYGEEQVHIWRRSYGVQAPGPGTGRPSPSPVRPALCEPASRRHPGLRMPGRHRGPHAALLAQRHRPGHSRRATSAGGGPRQQHPGPGEAFGWALR